LNQINQARRAQKETEAHALSGWWQHKKKNMPGRAARVFPFKGKRAQNRAAPSSLCITPARVCIIYLFPHLA